MQLKFTTNDEAIGNLSIENMVALIKVLGDKTTSSMCTTWVSMSNKYKAASPTHTYYLAWSLAPAEKAGISARRKIAEHVKATYLKDKAAVHSVRCWYWRWYVLCLGKDLSGEDRKLWAQRLREAFTGSPKDLVKLKTIQFWFMAYAVSTLDTSESPPMVLAWFNANKEKGFDSVSAHDLARIANAGWADRVVMAPVMNQFETIWLARHSQNPLDLVTFHYIIATWHGMGEKAKAQQWTLRAYETMLGADQAKASADAGTLKVLGRWLWDTGLTVKGKAYPAFADVLARLAREDKIPFDKWWRYRYYAAPLCTPEARQTLQAELTDAAGNPRTVVASILAIAYREADEIDAWKTFVDKKMAEPGVVGDTRALWLLARAWAEAFLTHEPYPLYGRQWLEEVLDTTTSAALRIVAIEQLVLGYAAACKFDEGYKFLDSTAKRFPDERTADAIKALRPELVRSEIKYLQEQIALSRIYEKKMNALAAGAQEGKDREFYLKWAEYDRQRENELILRLEQIGQ
ncbi:MAG: hypothetical protein SVV80_13675 [Planctomycetota bacterium]|nr:hypothetical protein [Planctomycetota bacterium]